jgi:hypothetical protein
MHKTRKQRAGGKHHPSLPSFKKYSFNKSSFLGTVRRRPRRPLISIKVPTIIEKEPNTNMAIIRGAKKSQKRKKKPKRPARIHIAKTLKIKPTTTVKTYIREVKTILYKINEILRDPEDGDYDLAIETSAELGKKLNRLERDLDTDKTELNEEDPSIYNEIIERYIELIEEFYGSAERMLIATTVDEVLNEKRRILLNSNSNHEIGGLVAMLGDLGPFRS